MDWKRYWNQTNIDPDVCKQVGRTVNKQNYSSHQIEEIIHRICAFLEAQPNKSLLELACGNGMITIRLAPHFQKITAIDFSEPLIAVAKDSFSDPKVKYLVGDALDLSQIKEKYDCVLVYFAFQYFSPEQAHQMFAQLRKILNPGGIILLGEVADGDRIWNFYRGWRGRWLHLKGILQNKPIIGYWWKSRELKALADSFDLDLAIFYQGKSLPNHYFRYDAVLKLKS